MTGICRKHAFPDSSNLLKETGLKLCQSLDLCSHLKRWIHNINKKWGGCLMDAYFRRHDAFARDILGTVGCLPARRSIDSSRQSPGRQEIRLDCHRWHWVGTTYPIHSRRLLALPVSENFARTQSISSIMESSEGVLLDTGAKLVYPNG